MSALHAQIAFATNYPDRLLTDPMITFRQNTSRNACTQLEVERSNSTVKSTTYACSGHTCIP